MVRKRLSTYQTHIIFETFEKEIQCISIIKRTPCNSFYTIQIPSEFLFVFWPMFSATQPKSRDYKEEQVQRPKQKLYGGGGGG